MHRSAFSSLKCDSQLVSGWSLASLCSFTFTLSVGTGPGRPAAGCSDAAGLQHVLHAATAQNGHSQEEAQHQTIQGYTLY